MPGIGAAHDGREQLQGRIVEPGACRRRVGELGQTLGRAVDEAAIEAVYAKQDVDAPEAGLSCPP